MFEGLRKRLSKLQGKLAPVPPDGTCPECGNRPPDHRRPSPWPVVFDRMSAADHEVFAEHLLRYDQAQERAGVPERCPRCGCFGRGPVELVELGLPDELHDSIVATLAEIEEMSRV